MQISFLYLLLTFTITSVTADIDVKKVDIRLPVHRPEETDIKNPENVNDLLATLFEMHHDLLAQISILEDKLKNVSATHEQSVIQHMVEHYTAQKNNIEYSIQLIQSNSGLNTPLARSNVKDSSIETKSIPLLVNFFRRNQAQTNEQTNANIGYSLPSYQPYYETQPAPTYVYQAAPQNNPNGQVYLSGDHQAPVYYQEQPNQQINQQFAPTPQVQAEPQYQPQYQPQPQPQPQHHPQPQPQFQVQSQPQTQQQLQDEQQAIQQVQETLQEPQYQPQLQVQSQLEQQLQPQTNSQFQAQFHPQQQIQPQPQIQPHQQTQYEFEAVFKPSSLPVRQPQVPEHDTQRYQQQGPFGQKEGIFVYYPNGVITDDKDRPSTANRITQVFDRFGQAISNLGTNWQMPSNPTTENGLTSVPRSEGLQTKHRLRGSHLKLSNLPKSKTPMVKNTTPNPSEGETKQDK